jgi:simple sugar transport system ATP-binding protein
VSTPLLALEGVAKRFGTFEALAGVSMSVRPGSVHALLGENGAGKTTLMRIAYGMLRPDAGTVRVNSVTAQFRSPADALDAGVGMVHQHFMLVPAMTVAENVALATRQPYRRAAARSLVRAVASDAGLDVEPDAFVRDLGVASQQRVEIIKALARRVSLLVFDEPTAVLTPSEAGDLLRWMRTAATGGRGAVLITHKLEEALAVADEVTVLRRGRVVLQSPAAALSSASLVRAMLGEGLEAIEPRRTGRHIGEAVVRVSGVSVIDAAGVMRVRDASFEVRAGEIVGLAAVEGSGHHELLRAVAGRVATTGGTIEAPVAIGFVPEDRHRDALVLELDLVENVAMGEASRKRGRMPWRSLEQTTRHLIDRFGVRAPGVRAPVATLSGGNQQRLVLARELARGSGALIAENPTRGLDVRATRMVHEQLHAARERGVAILLHSSDIEEVLLLADRMLVMHAGSLREVAGDRNAIGRAMLGAA